MPRYNISLITKNQVKNFFFFLGGGGRKKESTIQVVVCEEKYYTYARIKRYGMIIPCKETFGETNGRPTKKAPQQISQSLQPMAQNQQRV